MASEDAKHNALRDAHDAFAGWRSPNPSRDELVDWYDHSALPTSGVTFDEWLAHNEAEKRRWRSLRGARSLQEKENRVGAQ